jgi:hypothetical protein
MTIEEKLRKLYEIAVSNGYKCRDHVFKTSIKFGDFTINGLKITSNSFQIQSSIGDQINSYIIGEITFIEALCIATNNKYDWQEIWREWATYPEGTPRPDNLRLDWLFDTFSELLNK